MEWPPRPFRPEGSAGGVRLPEESDVHITEIQDALTRQPFEPFRLHLSGGQTYVVRHPEFAALTQWSVYVGVSSGEDAIPDRMVQCDIRHVVAIEPVNGAMKPGG